MKEALRSIYRVAKGAWEAKAQLRQWIAEARECALTELTRIAGTFEKRIDGIAAFWDNHLSNAHMEGFNSKLKGLIKMANGYTDSEFLKLKIYDLPDQKMIDLTHLPTEMWELRRSIQFGYSPS